MIYVDGSIWYGPVTSHLTSSATYVYILPLNYYLTLNIVLFIYRKRMLLVS